MENPLLGDTGEDSAPVDVSAFTVGEVTQLVTHWNAGSPEDQAKLLTLVYPELKRIAEFRMRRERPDHTLQATALVNEFVIHLCSAAHQPLQSRVQILAVASRAMRRILVDYARAHNAEKRGGSCRVQLVGAKMAQPRELSDILEIHDLLDKLAGQDIRMAKVVELRYFGGMSNGEVAETLGVAERTVKRDWQLARAWLYTQLHRNELPGSPLHGGKADAG
jgi:RNA polymerase sigma factor (TIGR02999 family)